MSDTIFSSTEEPPNIAASSAKVQELLRVQKLYRESREKLKEYETIVETVKGLIKDPNIIIDNKLCAKINEIVLETECSSLLYLDADGMNAASFTVLGIRPEKKALNFTDGNQLRQAVLVKLKQKYTDIGKEYQDLTGQDAIKLSDNWGASENVALIESKERLLATQKLYLGNLKREKQILEEFAKIRLKETPNVATQVLKEFALNTRLNHLKSRILDEKARVNIFTETLNALNAYEQLLFDLKSQQDECTYSIALLKQLKEKYSKVSCKEFDVTLRQFVQYKAAIEKKKSLLEFMK